MTIGMRTSKASLAVGGADLTSSQGKPMSDEIRPTISRGWYGYTDDEIAVAMEAILRPESMPRESHLHLEPIREASPIIDKTLLLAVSLDLVADQRMKLQRLESQLEIVSLRLQGIEEGHGSDRTDTADVGETESG